MPTSQITLDRTNVAPTSTYARQLLDGATKYGVSTQDQGCYLFKRAVAAQQDACAKYPAQSVVIPRKVRSPAATLVQALNVNNVFAIDPGSWLPTNLAGCSIWLDGATPALADGTQLSSWSDGSGTSHNFIQATSGLQPLYKTNVINGKPAVRLDNVDDSMTTASAIAFSGGFTLFMVFLTRDISADNRYTGHLSDLKAIHLRLALGGYLSLYTGSGFQDIVLPGVINTGVVYGLTVNWNGTQATARVNGLTQLTSAFTGLTWPAGTGLGRVYGQGVSPNADIAELILYNTSLTTPDVRMAEAYLQKKYQFTYSIGQINTVNMFDKGHYRYLAADSLLSDPQGGGTVVSVPTTFAY